MASRSQTLYSLFGFFLGFTRTIVPQAGTNVSQLTTDWTRLTAGKGNELYQFHCFTEAWKGPDKPDSGQKKHEVVRMIINTWHLMASKDMEQGALHTSPEGQMPIDLNIFTQRDFWRGDAVFPLGVADVDVDGGGLPVVTIEQHGLIINWGVSLGLIMEPDDFT